MKKKIIFTRCSWHEIATRDLPAMIDYILNNTKQDKLFYLGHSQGTTTFFVMSTEMPEYQNKVKAMFAMAPVAYCSRIISPIFKLLAKFVNTINVCITYAISKTINVKFPIFSIFLSFFKCIILSPVSDEINRPVWIRAYHRGYEEISGCSVCGGFYHATNLLKRIIPYRWVQHGTTQQSTILSSINCNYFILFYEKCVLRYSYLTSMNEVKS